MYLQKLELAGFKSFAKKASLDFNAPISAIVGPNGSGKSNIAEAFRFVLGEQSLKSMRGKRGEDLIWGGGKNASRANRASAKVIFDNDSRLFDLDFDEVIVERIVHRDGVNRYLVNGSQVRLRDVVELLAAANIGSSGHHIISQGEADHILNASPRERREMIEDALGLKIYHYKLAESERRLLKTRENIAQVEALQKEIAPHLRFLRKQAERVKRARAMREDLTRLYQEYLKRESVYLAWRKGRVTQAKVHPEGELARLEKELGRVKETLERERSSDAKSKEIINLEEKLRSLREEKDIVARDMGRLEGELNAERRSRKRVGKTGGYLSEPSVPLGDLKNVISEITASIEPAERSDNPSELKSIIRQVRDQLRAFLVSVESERIAGKEGREENTHLVSLTHEHEEKSRRYQKLEEEERDLQRRYAELKREIEEVRDRSREAERRMFSIMGEQNKLRGELQELLAQERELVRDKEAFDRELEEGVMLAGREILAYGEHNIILSSGEKLRDGEIVTEDRKEQERRRREIEKIKIRLEEFGGGGEEIMKEFEEMEERDQYLSREIADLERSAASLKKIMKELEEKLESRFKEGVVKINREFQGFFSLMFGGGTASLSVVRTVRRRSAPEMLLISDEQATDEAQVSEEEEGIEVSVTLPRKRVKGLVMLSGGERALTSIALLFAMSQVNPPPFLILDETDAALDEANSKRYGDMVEKLSKNSQLILITHNRETMSRASLLYGVTMGSDGMSKLLSVKFEEVVSAAAA